MHNNKKGLLESLTLARIPCSVLSIKEVDYPYKVKASRYRLVAGGCRLLAANVVFDILRCMLADSPSNRVVKAGEQTSLISFTTDPSSSLPVAFV